MIEFAAHGRGNCASFVRGEHDFEREFLNEDQRAAVTQALGPQDWVIAMQGGAGVNKTMAMKEIMPAIEAIGKEVFPFAPSTDASRGELQNRSFDKADMLAQLLKENNHDLVQKVRGQVVWVQEAGEMDAKADDATVVSRIDIKEQG